MTITADILKAIVPGIKQVAIDTFLPHLQALLPKYHIDTPQRMAGFIAPGRS
jgi:predicted chitinase